jgi:cytochrome c2
MKDKACRVCHKISEDVKAKVQPMANNPKNAEIITGLTDDGREVTAHWRKTRGIEGGG